MGKRESFKEGGSKMLVVFEGLDNCGKTTIVERLKKYYDQQGIPAEFTREFETDVGKLIKKNVSRKSTRFDTKIIFICC